MYITHHHIHDCWRLDHTQFYRNTDNCQCYYYRHEHILHWWYCTHWCLQKMFDNAKSKAMLAHHCKYDCQCWDCILQDKYRNSCLECCYRFVCILSCAPHIHQCLKESDRTFLQPTNTQEVYYHCKCDHQDPVAIHCHRYSSRTHKYYDSSGHSYHWQWNTHRHLMVVWLSRTHFTQ